MTETASGTNVAVLISGPGSVDPGKVPSGSTPTIWVGAYDDTGAAPSGIGSEDLDVQVTKPDGNTESFSRTTDSNGQASVDYDTSQSGRGDGDYKIQVSDPDGTEVAESNMTVGLNLESTSTRGDAVYVGEQSTFAVLAHDGESPVSGQSLTLEVIENGTSQKSTSKSTDSNGFATISYTPSATGDLVVTASGGGRSTDGFVTVTDKLAQTDFDLTQAVVGTTSTYGAYLESPSGVIANTDVQLSIYKDFEKTDLLTQKTVTADDAGFFTVDYDVPSDFSGDALFASAQTGSGDPISLARDRISVSQSASGGGSFVTLSANEDGFRYSPGDTVTIDVEATDGGNAIANQDVDIFLRYGFDGPPFYSTTVTTGSNGTASASASLPSDAPDGEFIRGTAGMSYDGDTYRSTLRAQIQELNVNFDAPPLTPGASESYSIDVSDADTGDAVSGVPLLFDARYGNGLAGSFGTAGLESGSDGTDSVSLSIPSDIGFETLANYAYRYRGLRTARIFPPDHPGTLSTGDTLVAGKSATFDFSGFSGVTTYGFAFGQTPAGRTFAKQFQGPGTFSLTVPEEYESGDSLELRVWAIDGNGDRYYDRQLFTVDASAFLSERWRTNTGSRVQYAQMATDGTNVFAGNLGSKLRALSPSDGSFVWSTGRSGDLSDSSPTVASGTVYVGSGGGRLYAIDAGNGITGWAVNTNSAVVSSPTVHSGVVYFGANDGGVRAVDSTGSIQWYTSLDAAVYSQPAVANGRVHVTTTDGNLVTLDASDGSELWRVETSADLGHTGVLESNGYVYLPADKLYKLDASNGNQAWTASFGGPAGSSPTLDNGTIYVGSSDGSVYAVNTDGTSAWISSTGGAVASDPAIETTSGRVVVGSTDGSLYVFDASDGSEVGSTSLGAPTRSSPVLVDGDVYIGTEDGDVVSLANVSG